MTTPRTAAGQRLLERLIKSRFFNDPDLVRWIKDIEAEVAAPALTAEALAEAMAATHSAEGPKPKLSLVLLPWATRILARLAPAAAEARRTLGAQSDD